MFDLKITGATIVDGTGRPAFTGDVAVQDGKIIVVLEAESERELADRIEDLRHDPWVLFVNLVFHQMDDA